MTTTATLAETTATIPSDVATITTPAAGTATALMLLAGQINESHRQAERAQYESLAHARAAGEKLLEAKASLQHGEFMSWVEGNCEFAHSTACLYMKVAREWDAKFSRVRSLPLREAARLVYGDDTEETIGGPKRPRCPPVEVDVETLKPHPRNYRRHPEEQLVHIAQSIRDHGLYRPIVVGRGDVVLAGHGLLKAARLLGYRTVPVARLDLDPHEPRALRILAGDNEISRTAQDDDRALVGLLEEVREDDATRPPLSRGLLDQLADAAATMSPRAARETDALRGTGYDAMQLNALRCLTAPPDAVQSAAEARAEAQAEWERAGMPPFDPGSQQFTLTIMFRGEEDATRFVEEKDVQVTRRNAAGWRWSAWWPARERVTARPTWVEARR